MNPELLDKILQCPDLPSLPAIAAQVIDLTSDENVSIDLLAQTITNDQALAAKILRTVNSSFYGLREPCSTIKRAVVLMGLKPVKTLALSFSLVSAIAKSADPSFDYESYWRRGLYTGIAARVLLEQRGLREHAEEAFLGGLLQDVGMLAMNAALGDEYRALVSRAGSDHSQLARMEIEVFELQHSDIGAMLATRWKLPEQLVMPVKYHERATAAPGSCAQIVRAVAIGNLVHDMLTSEHAAASMKQAYDKAKKWFAMRTDEVDEVVTRTGESASELASLFEISTGPAADPAGVLARASGELERLASEDPSAVAIGDGSALIIEQDQVDALTGIFNQSGFRSVLRSAFHFARNKKEALSLVVVSLDGFAKIREILGEGSDAEIIMDATRLLREQFDAVAGVYGRMADDLLAVVVASVPRAIVTARGDAFRAALLGVGEMLKVEGGEGTPVLSASVGLACIESGKACPFESPEQLMGAAIRATQAAQKAGGNVTRTFVPRAA